MFLIWFNGVVKILFCSDFFAYVKNEERLEYSLMLMYNKKLWKIQKIIQKEML